MRCTRCATDIGTEEASSRTEAGLLDVGVLQSYCRCKNVSFGTSFHSALNPRLKYSVTKSLETHRGPGLKMKTWLIVWGALACIAFAAPGLVTVGMFLIVPGLILIAAPTIFLYSLLFVLFKRVMRIPPGWRLNAVAAALSVFCGWAVAQPWAVVSHYRFNRANLPEVYPASPIKLAGNIRLETPPQSSLRKPGPESCRDLCAALLDTPGVTSVALSATGARDGDAPVVYRLISRDRDRSPSLFPLNPEHILDSFPLMAKGEPLSNFQARSAARQRDKQAIAVGWGVRLASTVKLTAERLSQSPDFTIRITDIQRGNSEVSISRVEVLDRDGKALLRRSVVTGSALSAPLRFNAYGSIENSHIALSRDRLSNAPANAKLEPIAELFHNTSIATPKADPGAVSSLLDRIRNASRNPATSSDDPDFGLAELWLSTVEWQHPLPPDQLSVLKLVISDPRISVPKRIYAGYESEVAPELRDALASRIVHPSTPPETRAQLARLLSRMPAGTFASPSPNEVRAMSDPELRADAYPMIVRLADQGEKAVPTLVAIVRSDSSEQKPYYRRSVMNAVALAFAILGPEAHRALPEVDAFVSSHDEVRFFDSSSMRAWNVALARMGKPIDRFDWKGYTPQFVARQRENLRKQVERFDPNDVWRF